MQFTRKLSWKLLVQRWNFDQNIGGEADRLIYFPQCKVNSKLDFRLKKGKLSRVIKKPNWKARWRNVVGHIYKQTCLRSDTHWKLLLYLDFRSFFGKYWPKLLQRSTIVAFATPWYLHGKLLAIHRVNIISQISPSCQWNMIVHQK